MMWPWTHLIYRRTLNSMGGGHFKFPCAYPQIWRVRVDSGSFVRAYLWTDNSWHNFQVSQFTGQFLAFLDAYYSFGPWQSLCITQAGTNLKAGQSCGPEKVCLQPSIVRGSVGTPEGISSISGNRWIQCQALYFGSWILKASQTFQETMGFIV